jgi:predicted aldo/keto reductase-like oxidoreductase
MQYREMGKTGFRISALGFGAMRLPKRADGNGLDAELSVAMLHRAFERGVNYVDTAYMYGDGESERIVGRALKGWRDRVRLSTKLPVWDVKKRDDFRRILGEQLAKLNTDHVDFYHFHSLDEKTWREKVLGFGLLEEMARARDEGMIRFVSFSFHDRPPAMKTIIDSGAFASVLCQYNLIDRANEEMMAYARERCLGVVVMGPVGGGRLGAPTGFVESALPGGRGTPEIALRFVLANPNVSCALSGMSSMEQVERNVAVASDPNPLSAEEYRAVREVSDSRRQLARLYCTGCAYCMPCPHGVNIPVCFESMIQHKVYGMTDPAVRRYRSIGDAWTKGKRAEACVGCGECESKCPQKIPIRAQLKEVAAELGRRL